MSARAASVFGLVAFIFIVVPASAAQFFIVQDIQKQSCIISQEIPTGDQYIVVGDGGYGDEATAATDMKRMLACNPRDDAGGAAQNPTTAPTKQ
jgi:hypothetical protein